MSNVHLFKKLGLCLAGALVINVTFISAGVAASNSNKGSYPQGKPFLQIQSDIADVQSQINATVGSFDTLEERLDADEALLQQLLDENLDLQQTVGNLSGDTEALQAQIDANTQLISGLESEIDSIYDELDLTQRLVEGTCPDGSAIQEILDDGSVVCEEFGSTGGGSGGQILYTANQVVLKTVFGINPNKTGVFEVYCPLGALATAPDMEASARYFSINESRPVTRFLGPGVSQNGWRLVLYNNWNQSRNAIAGVNCHIIELQ